MGGIAGTAFPSGGARAAKREVSSPAWPEFPGQWDFRPAVSSATLGGTVNLFVGLQIAISESGEPR